MSSAIQPSREHLERRMNEYRADTFIKGCKEAIRRIVEKAVPHVKVDLKTMEFSSPVVDEPTRFNIEWWKMQIETYTLTHYSDIIFDRNENK